MIRTILNLRCGFPLSRRAQLSRHAPSPRNRLSRHNSVDPHYTAPASDKNGKARGISGMTCLGKAGDAKRECFVINDEETFGEVAI